MERDQTGPRILLVDDQVDITEVFSEILEGFGYQVMVARDGYDAVEMYFKHRPDLVLMDISLLSMDGDVATERILKKDPNAKILVLTSLRGEKVERALRAGALGVVNKPISAMDLVRKIEVTLRGEGV